MLGPPTGLEYQNAVLLASQCACGDRLFT